LIQRALVAAFVLVGAGFVAPAAPAASSIQPGTFISTPVGGCTLSFVYDGGGKVYMSTAAHCVKAVGDDVALSDGTVIGDAALRGNPNSTSADWALIEIRPAYTSRVKAGILGHPTMPKGYDKTSKPGDEVFISGYGIGFDQTAFTRQNRFGFMVSQSKSHYTLIGSDTYGDSGGPIVLAKDGKAMGIVSSVCLGLCTSEGPTVQGILQQVAAKGLAVTLRTVAP
jgi:hypothetical protein